jgi:hypothetical protein
METIELKEKASGFTERDLHSKAILNTDTAGLLRYKIQRQKTVKMNEGVAEVQRVREELTALKSEMNEIKQLLLKITTRE